MSPTRRRLFVAAWPPSTVVEQLRAVIGGHEPGVRWIKAGNWHVTLRFVGDADPDAIVERLDRAPLTATKAVLGPAFRRLGRGMVVVPAGGLDELAAAVRRATAGVGDPPDPRRYTGHVTLARLRPGARTDVVGRPFAAQFGVDEVTLVSSVLGRGGSAYEVIARWPTV